MTADFFCADPSGYRLGDLIRNPDDPTDEQRYRISGSTRYDSSAGIGPAQVYELQVELAAADPAGKNGRSAQVASPAVPARCSSGTDGSIG